MAEKRKSPRLKEENEITITVVSGRHNLSKEVMYNRSKVSLLPEPEFRPICFYPLIPFQDRHYIKNVHQIITVMGKVNGLKSFMMVNLMRRVSNSSTRRMKLLRN